MSTHDVPGANPANADKLAIGCWAEHEDGSLIFVESTETGRVIYSVFDMAKAPPIEYRDAMPEATFKKTFTWDPASKKKDKWTWHDKTPFDWNRIIKAGIPDGGRHAFAEHQMNAAERVADSLRLRGSEVSRDLQYRADTSVDRSADIWDKITRALAELAK